MLFHIPKQHNLHDIRENLSHLFTKDAKSEKIYGLLCGPQTLNYFQLFSYVLCDKKKHTQFAAVQLCHHVVALKYEEFKYMSVNTVGSNVEHSFVKSLI